MSFNVSEKNGALVFDVQVVPRASKEAFGKIVGDRLKIYLTAPPVDGAANTALTRFVAHALGVAPSHVAILAGQTGRKKTLQVVGGDRNRLIELIRE